MPELPEVEVVRRGLERWVAGRTVATVGLDNVIVVDTEDALLVVDRGRSQDVRKIVDLLKGAMRSRLT